MDASEFDLGRLHWQHHMGAKGVARRTSIAGRGCSDGASMHRREVVDAFRVW